MGQSEMPPTAGEDAPIAGDATFGAAPRLPRGPNNLTAEEIAEAWRRAGVPLVEPVED